MFCKNCGRDGLSGDAIFCPSCGAQTGNSDAVAKATTVEPWTTNKFTWLIVLSLLMPVIGWIFGIIGLTKEPTRNQGGIVLAVGILAAIVWSQL